MKEFDVILHASESESDAQKKLLELFKDTPIPDSELLSNLGLFLTSKSFSRLLFFYELYKQISTLHGVIMEFGTRYGQTAAILSALRAMFEPFNRTRKIIAFDTFEGLRGVSAHDAGENKCTDGSYAVPPGYDVYLKTLLSAKEKLDPLSHLQKHDVIKGDIAVTLPEYLQAHPETVISLAVFDMDIYAPTRTALEAIKPYLCSGSILVFDEVCDDVFPGETVALRESFDMSKLSLVRLPITSRLSYLVYR